MNDILRSSILRFIRKRYPYLIFFLLSLAPFTWHSNLFQVQFIGSADYLSPYVTPQWIAQTTSVYGPQVGGGADYAYLLAYLFLYNIPVRILHALGTSGPVISISILAVLLFVSQLSMFLFVKYVIQEKLQLKHIPVTLLSTFGAILYGFSPYLVGIIAPGHIFQIYSYVTFPLLLLFTDKFLSSKQYKWKYLITLYYIFFLSSPAFANIGILYVTILILGFYYLLINFFYRNIIIQSTIKTIFIFISAILSNIWWLLPYITNFGQALTVNHASTIINEAVNTAVKDASIANIFFGRAESLFFGGVGNTFFSNEIVLILFTGLLFLAFYPYIEKDINKRYHYILLFLFLFGAFISKGPNDPFGFLFNWMYDLIPGFQIFRRPVSKLYWFFLLILFTMSIIGAAYTLSKTKNRYWERGVIGFLLVACAYFVIVFIRTPLLIPFSVPEYYSTAKQYFDQTNVNRILILPGFYGTYPTYNKTLNNYYGVDFIPHIWSHQIVEPNSTMYGEGSPTKNEVNSLVNAILGNRQFCSDAEQLGISHIVVRQDIHPLADTEGLSEEFISILSQRPEISEVHSFSQDNSGIIIYRLNKSCRGQEKLYLTNGLLKYLEHSPALISGTLISSAPSSRLSLLLNESNQWILYRTTYPESFYPLKSLIHAFYKIPKVPSGNGALNTWIIPLSNDDIHFILFYQPQAYFCLGLLILVSTHISIICLLLYSHAQRNNSKPCK